MSTSIFTKFIAILLLTMAVGVSSGSAQDVSVTLNNGTLTITGTSRGDTVSVKAGKGTTLFNVPASVVVNIEGRQYLPFPIENVNKIVFNGGNGDDTFEIKPTNSGRTINDLRANANLPPITTLIRGGSGSDVLIGGDGVIDEIHYTKDDIVVEGGDGNDVFWRPSSYYLIGGFYFASYPKPDDFDPREDFLGTDFKKFLLDFRPF